VDLLINEVFEIETIMTILIVYTDPDDNSIRVSHGINSETLETVVLPNELLRCFRPVFLQKLGEWVLF
jgi:hypothetical protein